jgi:hypothetical protein
MIAGGAAYGYWALKSPVPIRAREPEKGSTIFAGRNRSGPAALNLYLIDSPDFSGLSAVRAGAFLFRGARGQAATLFWRSQLALKPAHRPVGFKGIDPVAAGAFEPAQPVAIDRHW